MKNVIIECDRVILREVETSDLAFILKWKKDPLISKMALGNHSGKETEVSVREDIKNAIENKKELYLIIVLKEKESPIGYIRINWLDNFKCFAWLRFALGEHRGEGYAEESLKCLISYLFRKGVHRFDAEVYEFNKASINLLRKIGFREEGIKREAMYNGVKHYNIIVFGLLERDFNI